MKSEPFYYVLETDSALAIGGTKKLKQKIDASRDFELHAIMGVVFDNATGFELPRQSPSDSVLVPKASLNKVGVAFGYGSEKISEKSMPMGLVTGTGDKPLFFVERPSLKSGKEFEAEITNDTGLAIDVKIVLVGVLKG